MISIIIPTLADKIRIESLRKLLFSLSKQDYQDFEIKIILDKKLDEFELDNIKKEINHWFDNFLSNKIIFISNQNSNFEPWKWASYTRNYWIENTSTEFLYFFDDDNIFGPDFLRKTLDIYENKSKEFEKDFILSSSIIYRETNVVQNSWFIKFNFLLSKPIKNNKDYGKVKMIWANSFFWKTKLLKENKFNEKIKFIYEDLDWSYNFTKKWNIIWIDKNLKINHMDRNKHILEKAYVWNSKNSYLKAKNRIIFIKNNWNSFEKIQSFFIGIRIQNIRLSLKILIYWKNLNKFKIIKNLWLWTIAGFKKV